MTDYVVHLTEQAEENYKNICIYLESQLKSSKAKDNFKSKFDNKMETLSKSPTIFKICEYPPLAFQQIRWVLINNYKAYYQIDNSTKQVNILYIKHCLQNENKLS